MHPYYELQDIDWQRINIKVRTCGKCKQSFDTKYELLVHTPCFQQSKYFLYDKKSGQHEYKCQNCDYSSSKLSHLQYHMSHHFSATYRCNHCMLTTDVDMHMFKHLRNVHYSSKCPGKGCTKKLTSKIVMMRHLSRKHPEYQECEFCARILHEQSFRKHQNFCRGSKES
jgi:hypothetical protein